MTEQTSETIGTILFIIVMGAVIYGLMGSDAWLWQLFAYFIGL